MIRQGDILFIPLTADELPASIKRLESGVIAEGEATGHHHRIAELDMPAVELYEATDWQNAGDKYLRITEHGISIVHEEHKTVTVPPGLYAIHQAREFDYMAQFARAVRD